MFKDQIIYFLLILYSTAVLGTFIKLKQKNINNLSLVYYLIIPLIAILAGLITSWQSFIEPNQSLARRTKETFNMIKTSIGCMPILITRSGMRLSEINKRQMRNKVKSRPRSKRSILVDIYNQLFKDIEKAFELSAKNCIHS